MILVFNYYSSEKGGKKEEALGENLNNFSSFVI